MAGNEVLVVGYESGEGRSSWPVVAQVTPLVTVLRAGFDDLPMIADHSRLAFARRPDGGTERAGDDVPWTSWTRALGSSCPRGSRGRRPSPSGPVRGSPGMPRDSSRPDLPVGRPPVFHVPGIWSGAAQ